MTDASQNDQDGAKGSQATENPAVGTDKTQSTENKADGSQKKSDAVQNTETFAAKPAPASITRQPPVSASISANARAS